ncbi:MAG TPA: acyltransferase [Mycobacteriales bacterium]|nr:acyltransferase [Mycobacteriales bacterium]
MSRGPARGPFAEWRNEPLKAVALRARLAAPRRRRQFHSFGAGSILHKPAWVYGPHHIAVGSNVILLEGLWLSAERVGWNKPEPTLRLGDGVGVRPFCTISAAESVVLEDNVILSAYTSVLDSEHTWRGGHPNPVWNPLDTAPVRIGEGTLVGAGVAVLAGANIGRFCFIGANSVVKGEIPDFSIAVGAPARVVGTTFGKGTEVFR